MRKLFTVIKNLFSVKNAIKSSENLTEKEVSVEMTFTKNVKIDPTIAGIEEDVNDQIMLIPDLLEQFKLLIDDYIPMASHLGMLSAARKAKLESFKDDCEDWFSTYYKVDEL